MQQTKFLKTIELHLPEEFLSYLGQDPKEVETRVLQSVLLTLFQQGKITAAYAAEVLGCTYWEFLDILNAHNLPVVNYDPDEIAEGQQILNEHLSA